MSDPDGLPRDRGAPGSALCDGESTPQTDRGAKRKCVIARPHPQGSLAFGELRILFPLEQEWISNILVVVSAGLFVAFGAGVRSDSGRSAAAVGIVFVVVLEVGHR